MAKDYSDLYKGVTDTIVAAWESGDVGEWIKSWVAAGMPCNAVSNRKYTGLNPLYLRLVAEQQGYGADRWLTPNQAIKVGRKYGRVAFKGEKTTQVPHFRPIIRENPDGTKTFLRFQIKVWRVLNVAQVKGLPEHIAEGPVVTPLSDSERDTQAEAFFTAVEADTKVSVSHGGDRACYSPSADTINMPAFASFDSPSAYYSTRGHECVHSTGHKSRLDRSFDSRFGSDAYAMEELVAEIGSAFLCATLALPGKLQHPEYVANWLKVLKGDTKAIFTAASQAQKAHAFLLKAGGLELPEPEGETL